VREKSKVRVETINVLYKMRVSLCNGLIYAVSGRLSAFFVYCSFGFGFASVEVREFYVPSSTSICCASEALPIPKAVAAVA
jgi:hypothetical protein